MMKRTIVGSASRNGSNGAAAVDSATTTRTTTTTTIIPSPIVIRVPTSLSQATQSTVVEPINCCGAGH